MIYIVKRKDNSRLVLEFPFLTLNNKFLYFEKLIKIGVESA